MLKFTATEMLPAGKDPYMAKGGITVAAVEELARPIAQELGLSIWDIRYLKEGTDWFLRIFIEREGGTSIDDCVAFSRAIDKPLDEKDFIDSAYTLEVCSPGLERELSRPEHFERWIGRKVQLKTIRPVNGEREFHGILESFDAPDITVRLEDGSGFKFTKKEVAWVKADDFEQ